MSDVSFEQAVSAMLQDPEQLQKIFALAQSLGVSPPAAPEASPPPPAPSCKKILIFVLISYHFTVH